MQMISKCLILLGFLAENTACDTFYVGGIGGRGEPCLARAEDAQVRSCAEGLACSPHGRCVEVRRIRMEYQVTGVHELAGGHLAMLLDWQGGWATATIDGTDKPDREYLPCPGEGLAFTPDGTHAVLVKSAKAYGLGLAHPTLTLCPLAGGEPLPLTTGAVIAANGTAATPTGNLIVGGAEQTTLIDVQARTTTMLAPFGGQPALSPDGRLLALGREGRIRMFDLTTHATLRTLFTRDIAHLAWIGVDHLVAIHTCSEDAVTCGASFINRSQASVEERQFPSQVIVAGDRVAWTDCEQGRLHFADGVSGALGDSLSLAGQCAPLVVASADGRLVGSTQTLWSTLDGSVVQSLDCTPMALWLSPDAAHLAALGCVPGAESDHIYPYQLEFFDLSGDEAPTTLVTHAPVASVTWLPDRTVVIGLDHRFPRAERPFRATSFERYAPETGLIEPLTDHPRMVTHALFEAGGTLLALGNDGVARRWSPRTGALLGGFSLGLGEVRDVQLSPDGKHLAATGLTRGCPGLFAFTPSGAEALSPCGDGTAIGGTQVWSLDTWPPTVVFQSTTPFMPVSVDFAPAGQHILLGFDDEEPQIWPLHAQPSVDSPELPAPSARGMARFIRDDTLLVGTEVWRRTEGHLGRLSAAELTFAQRIDGGERLLLSLFDGSAAIEIWRTRDL